MTLTRDQELWGMALWVEKHHGDAGHEFADLNPRHIGRYRLAFAPDFRRGVQFKVVHVLMRWCPSHIDHDDRFV